MVIARHSNAGFRMFKSSPAHRFCQPRPGIRGEHAVVRWLAGHQREGAWLTRKEIALLLMATEIVDAPLEVVDGAVSGAWKKIRKEGHRQHAAPSGRADELELAWFGSQGEKDGPEQQG